MLSKRRAIIISIIIAATLVVACAATLTVACVYAQPTLSVLGEDEQNIEVFSEYKASNVEAEVKLLGIKIKLNTKTVGELNTEKVGRYTVKHTTSFFGKTVEKTQIINVVDSVAPQIYTEDYNINVDFVGYPIDPDAVKISYTASDNVDGDITDKVQKTVDGDTCVLTVADSFGNETKREINLIINDGERPTIVLAGASSIFVAIGKGYSEPGYSAKDNKDGDITSKVTITDNIDYTCSGTYYKHYTVSDEAGNTAKLSRKVIIYGSKTADDYKDVKPNGKTVYLTFDDGPGVYTEKLLSHLDRYNVKATFFVTNQFSKYQHLIKSAHDKGHKIAIHTLTHKWSIYQSVDSYMRDFNAIQEIIKSQTGSETNIFRFPGGTNNTISRGHCKGIMTTLTQQMTDAGYFYFDWNVDSNDSRYKNAQSVISDTINQISKKNNAVVLMHDIKKHSVEAVPAIIEYCLQNGYTFKVLDENSPVVRFKPAN